MSQMPPSTMLRASGARKRALLTASAPESMQLGGGSLRVRNRRRQAPAQPSQPASRHAAPRHASPCTQLASTRANTAADRAESPWRPRPIISQRPLVVGPRPAPSANDNAQTVAASRGDTIVEQRPAVGMPPDPPAGREGPHRQPHFSARCTAVVMWAFISIKLRVRCNTQEAAGCRVPAMVQAFGRSTRGAGRRRLVGGESQALDVLTSGAVPFRRLQPHLPLARRTADCSWTACATTSWAGWRGAEARPPQKEAPAAPTAALIPSRSRDGPEDICRHVPAAPANACKAAGGGSRFLRRRL